MKVMIPYHQEKKNPNNILDIIVLHLKNKGFKSPSIYEKGNRQDRIPLSYPFFFSKSIIGIFGALKMSKS